MSCPRHLSLVLLLPFLTAAEVREFHVAPTGSDDAAGTAAAPFRTVARARDAVRQQAGVPAGDITVHIAAGTYELAEPLTFGPEDSGRGGHRVIYQGAPGAVISGGTRVTGWTPDAAGRWKAPLTREVKLRWLYVDGRHAAMASRVADGIATGSFTITRGQAPWAWTDGTAVDGATYPTRLVPTDLRNPEDLEIHFTGLWNSGIVCVRDVTAQGDRTLLRYQQPYGAIAQTCFWETFRPGGRKVLTNAYEFLGEPGQFYFDRRGSTVYYLPRPGEDPATASIVAPRLVHLVRIAGTDPAHRVRGLVFRGLTFAHSDWNLYEVGGSRGKNSVQGACVTSAFSVAPGKNWHADLYRNLDVPPGAIAVDHAEDLVFERNRLEHLASEAIALVNDVHRVQVVGNAITGTAGGAVLIGHPQHLYEGDGPDHVHRTAGVADAAGPDRERYPADRERVCHDLLIANNLIRDTCREFLGHAAITVFYADGARIEHNDITNTPFNAVSLGWGWSNTNGASNSVLPGKPTTTARNNRVSFNRFHRVMQVLNDSGAIYTLGSQPDTMIAGNFINGVGTGDETAENKRYARHCDGGSAYITTKDLVCDIGPRIWTVHGFYWDGQHDDPMDTIFSTSARCSSHPSLTGLHLVPDRVWPPAAFAIVQRAGLEAAYDDLAAVGVPSLAERLLPVSVQVLPGTVLPWPALGRPGDDFALVAEDGSTVRLPTERATFTAPGRDGTYHLTASRAGTVTRSTAVVVVRSTPPRIEGLTAGATLTTAPRPTWEGQAYLDDQPMPLVPGEPLIRNGSHTLVARLANGLSTSVSFTLALPQSWIEAEQGTLVGDAKVRDEPSASGGKHVADFKATGAGLTFTGVAAGAGLRLVTWAGGGQQVALRINDLPPQVVTLPETLKPGVGQIPRWAVTEVPVTIPANATITLTALAKKPDLGVDAVAIVRP